MSVAAVLLWTLALVAEPAGQLEIDRKKGRALPPVIGSMAMLGVPLLSIASSVVLLDEAITAPLSAGTALVLAGMAIVILENAGPRR